MSDVLIEQKATVKNNVQALEFLRGSDIITEQKRQVEKLVRDVFGFVNVPLEGKIDIVFDWTFGRWHVNGQYTNEARTARKLTASCSVDYGPRLIPNRHLIEVFNTESGWTSNNWVGGSGWTGSDFVGRVHNNLDVFLDGMMKTFPELARRLFALLRAGTAE